MKGKKIVSSLVALLIVFLIIFSNIRICGEIEEMESTPEVKTVIPESIYEPKKLSMPMVFEESEEVKKEYIGRFLLTAYCPCEYCTDGDWITATGTKATEGRTVAVDPTIIPYGTEIFIAGKKYIAEDCGGVIKGKRIDVFFESHTDALEFGKRYANVEIEVNGN
jgi:3D (Asp-Asp-Asp) domain-containing protein